MDYLSLSRLVKRGEMHLICSHDVTFFPPNTSIVAAGYSNAPHHP
jgi:hypothetical protein